MATKFLNISTDNTLGGNSPSNTTVPSQKAIKEYVDNQSLSGGYHPGLFAHEWDDHLRNDVQWLRADTFSWQDGSVYEAAYKELLQDMYQKAQWGYSGGIAITRYRFPEVGQMAYSNSSMTTEIGAITETDGSTYIIVNNTTYSYQAGGIDSYNETIAGTTISYALSTTGRKIVFSDQESNVAAIYTATGAAWYYIIDTANQRFKLPRTSPQLRYVTERLNIDYTNPIQISNGGTSTVYGWFYISGHSYNGQETVALNGTTVYWGGNSGNERLSGDCILWVKPGDVITWSKWNGQVAMSKIYPAKYPEKAESGDKYLYFYVGSFTQTALENTAGVTTEALNSKADANFNNTNMIDYVVAKQDPTSSNGYTWYRKYKSGWVEQGGRTGAINGVDATASVSLPITMSNANYAAYVTVSRDATGAYRDQFLVAYNRNTTYFRVYSNWAGSGNASQNNYAQWLVCGMAAYNAGSVIDETQPTLD